MSGHHREPRNTQIRSDASFGGRKRKFDSTPRNAKVPKRGRTEGEAGDETGHASAPIGFKALESICREEVPENAILELTKKAERFEALLSLEEIRPDLLKLVVCSFRLLCSSNNIMTANAEKILRSSKAKNFVTGAVLSRFINEMAYSNDSSFGTVVADLTVVFRAMIQRFGESIVHGLPIPQLSTSLAALKEKSLIEDVSDLEKKLQVVKELKDEVIRRAKAAHESQVEPPHT